MSEGLVELIEKRGITEVDIGSAIAGAENKKTFMRDGSTIIGKLKVGNMKVYVVYARDGDLFTVQSAYSHRVASNR